MLDKVFSIGLDLFAFVLPISIAATNIVFFPLAALWLFGARGTFSRWPPFWGWPEKIFGVFFVVSLLSAGLGAGFAVLFVVVPSMRERAVSILDRTHHSNKERLHMWDAGIQIWKAHPLLGIGPGSIKEISVRYQTPEEKVWGSWGHLHSTYVNFLAERGLAGLLVFGVFMGALCRELWQALRRSSGDPWREAVLKGSLLGIVGFLTSGLTETAYNTAVVMMTFYFVVGLALALTRHQGVACD